MTHAIFFTKELDVRSFQAGIFISDAALLSPVVIYPSSAVQSLDDYLREQKEHPRQWMSYAGPAGVGQYSLKRHEPAGLLARFDVHFRYPTDDEMRSDIQWYGEQVLGPCVQEISEDERQRYANNAIVRIVGDDHFFVGPPRIIKSVFLTRVFANDLPEDITPLLNDVDEAAERGPLITFQGYQFIHAVDGRMKYVAFWQARDYDTSKLKLFGTVEIKGRKMTYFPGVDKKTPTDFSVALRDKWAPLVRTFYMNRERANERDANILFLFSVKRKPLTHL